MKFLKCRRSQYYILSFPYICEKKVNRYLLKSVNMFNRAYLIFSFYLIKYLLD